MPSTRPSAPPSDSSTGLDPLRRSLADERMTRFQWVVVAVCVLVNTLDGFDIQVMAFTSNAVTKEFGLSGSQLGLLLSAGFVGMAAGSLLIAPFADRVGRRPIVLACLVIAAVGMTLSAMTQSAEQLGLLRVLTGLGIGGILASNTVIAGEYASRRWHGMTIALTATGYSVGAIVGGILSVTLQSSFGWRSVFLFGGLATAAVLVLAAFLLPESLDHLLTRQPPRALDRVNRLARRMGRAPLDALPAKPPRTARGVAGGLRKLLGPELRRSTLILWVGFFLVLAGFYFVTSWTPRLLVEAGLTPGAGISGGVLINIGGLFGSVALGFFTARFAMRKVVFGYLLTSAVMLALFITTVGSLPLALCVAALIGLFLIGCVAGLYALVTAVYDADVRATGMGTAVGIGRIGAIIAPIAAGALLDGGWTPNALYVSIAVAFAVTAVVLLALRTSDPRAVDSPAAAGANR
ncbi:MFS transporter [Pseudonocardia sp. GCM10023141]|uniref:MFS transporter n=1 Tax=Pseudonocardia sp. GCM10023141 TaxID=3252653 RepID=UPI00361C53B7